MSGFILCHFFVYFFLVMKLTLFQDLPRYHGEDRDDSLHPRDDDVMVNFEYSEESIFDANYDEEPVIEETDKHARLVRTLFTTILKHCLYEFRILRRMHASLAKPKFFKHIKYETTEERFLDSSNYDDVQLGRPYTDVNKFQKDIGLTVFLLETLIDEAYKWGTFTMFIEKITVLSQLKHDEDNVMEEMQQKRDWLDQLRRSIVSEKQASISEDHMYSEALRNRMTMYQDALDYTTAEMKYIKDWEDSRYEQNVMKLDQKESNYKDCASDMQWKIDLEETCHQQFDDFVTLAQEDSLNEIQQWMERYDHELDAKEIEIYDMRTMVDKLKEEYESKQLDYETRTQQMEDWLEYKKNKREQEALAALQLRAATRIQAWWRRVMMIRKLGPYRKKKGKKDKAKGKGKKTTKKSDR